MRRVWTCRSCLLACLAALLALAGCTGESAKPEEFRIGIMAPLGSSVRFTAHLAAAARVDQINARGGLDLGGRKLKVRLVVEDTGQRTEQAMGAMARLVQQERVSAIIGPYYSREAIPVAAALEALRVPMITPTATNPEVTRGRKFAFRACQLDSDQGEVLARYAFEELGLRRAGVLYDEAEAYSSGLAGYFRENFAARRGATVHMETYATGAKDVMAQLGRIRAAGAQVLLLPNAPPDLSGQLQQARAAGFMGVLLGGDSWNADQGFHSLPEAQGAMFSTDFAPAAADPALLRAAQTLAASVGGMLGSDTAQTLDALELLLAAARAAGSADPVSLRSGLASLRGVEGLSGRTSYDGSGDPERPVNIMGIFGGSVTLRARLAPVRRGR